MNSVGASKASGGLCGEPFFGRKSWATTSSKILGQRGVGGPRPERNMHPELKRPRESPRREDRTGPHLNRGWETRLRETFRSSNLMYSPPPPHTHTHPHPPTHPPPPPPRARTGRQDTTGTHTRDPRGGQDSTPHQSLLPPSTATREHARPTPPESLMALQTGPQHAPDRPRQPTRASQSG